MGRSNARFEVRIFAKGSIFRYISQKISFFVWLKIASSDAWAGQSHVAARLREAWQEVTPAEMREHYRRSMAEGISNLPETEELPYEDEEFDCMTLEEWMERLSALMDEM